MKGSDGRMRKMYGEGVREEGMRVNSNWCGSGRRVVAGCSEM